MTPRGRIAALFLMELRTLLRDRRTVVLSILVPLLVMPVMLFASQWMEARRRHALETRESPYAVAGPRAADGRRLVDRAQTITWREPGGADRRLRLRETTVADPAAALAAESLDFYVLAENHAAADRDAAVDVDGAEAPSADLLTLTVVFRSDRDTSRRAADQLVSRLREVRQAMRDDVLGAAGSTKTSAAVLPTDTVDIAAASQVAGLAMGRLLTLLLVFFLLSGGAVVAQDTLAGEKERGTLETLLTTAISRREIVTAKVLLVLSTAVTITAIQVVNLLVYVGFGLIPTTRDLAAAITPAMAAGLLVFLLPLAALVAGVLVLVSGYARSYREAQLYFLPVMLVGAVPAVAAFLPGVSLRSAIVLVPVANISVGVKEMLVGRVDWLMMTLAWGLTAGAAAAAVVAAARLLSTERLIVPTAAEVPATGAGVRPGQVVVWFAVMWAVMLVISLNAGEAWDVRWQLLVNLVGIFLGGSLLFLRYHRLDPVEVLSLRAPHPAVWLAVLVGIPAGLIVGAGLFRLSQMFLPVPREMLEHFGQSLMPGHIPFWQLLPMMTILPGICEEIAFRGVLLHGLRRRFPAPVSILLAGIVFGLFHVALFRILQTGYLGILLATVTVLTGSIFPAMVWHAGSNGLALASAQTGLSLGAFEPVTYMTAVAALAVSLWIIWRTRAGARGHTWRRRPAGMTLALLVVVGVVQTVRPVAALQTARPVVEGRAALSRGDIRAAVAAADQALARNPVSEEAIALKLEALAEARDWETGLSAYDAFVAAGGHDRRSLLRLLGEGYLRETVAFYPTLRHNALGRLACAGNREALLELRRDRSGVRPDDIEGQTLKARLGDIEALAILRSVSVTGPPGLRAPAVQALQQLRDRGAEPAIIAALGQPDVFLRIAAIRAARALKLDSTLPLLGALAMDRNPQVSAEAVASRAVLGHEESAGRLPTLAASPTPEIRVAALAALAARDPSPRILDELAAAARSREGLAWAQALEELIPRDPSRAADAIRDALADPNPNNRVQALRLAARVPMEDEEDLARLRALFRDNHMFVRLEAATVAVGQSLMCGDY